MKTCTSIPRKGVLRHIPPGFGNGGQAPERELFNLSLPGQSFRSLYRAVADAIQECGPCSRSDIALIPAFNQYSQWQIERALDAARLHGYLRTAGPIPPSHPDAPQDLTPQDADWPRIYETDPAGPLVNRANTDALVQRSLAARLDIEIVWSSSHPPLSNPSSPFTP